MFVFMFACLFPLMSIRPVRLFGPVSFFQAKLKLKPNLLVLLFPLDRARVHIASLETRNSEAPFCFPTER